MRAKLASNRISETRRSGGGSILVGFEVANDARSILEGSSMLLWILVRQLRLTGPKQHWPSKDPQHRSTVSKIKWEGSEYERRDSKGMLLVTGHIHGMFAWSR